VRAAVEAWSTPDGIDFNILDPSARSNAVTTILTRTIDADELRRIAEEETGLVLGLGIGGPGQPRFRIGHMGHLNPPMLLGTLGTIEAVLTSMGAPTGASGAAAAAAHIAASL
jgi:alanine-glyoxylate transaminase/serine-glyoxylate transaminase/serine-pyruvate transaminase